MDVQRTGRGPPPRRRRRRLHRGEEGAGGTLGRRLRSARRPLPLQEGVWRLELESGPARAADGAGPERQGGRIPAGRRQPSFAAADEYLQRLREHGRQGHRSDSRSLGRRQGCAHHHRGARAHRGCLAQPRLDRRQYAQGQCGHQWQGGVCVRAQYGGPGPHLFQTLFLPAGGQAGHHRRRAFQWRRQRGRLLHRDPAEEGNRLVDHALWRRHEDAVRLDPGAARHADRRDGRLGRRPAAVDVPQKQHGSVDRQGHVGRPGRHPRLSRADGWRHHHGAEPGVLDARKRLGRGKRRRAARYRSRANAGRRHRRPRSAAGKSD